MSYYLEMANQALADYEASKQADRTSGMDALAIVKASGVRMATHRGERIIAVPASHDNPELREALEVLGYGGCRVLHLDTAPYRGKGVDSIAEAIEDRP
jgi:hypothetical protein